MPKFIEYYTTVPEWIDEKVKYMAKVVRWIWETIKTLVRNFVTQVRKMVDWVRHSKWVRTTRQVLKTSWESVKKRVPLLGWLGSVIGWIWKTVVEPVRRWVTETVRKLRTWMEKVVRYVRERVQDGWKTIASRVRKQVTDWVEKSKWVRKLVYRKIKVRKQDGWEYKTFFGGGGGKMASLVPSKKVLQQMLTAGLLTGVVASLNGCICNMKEIIPLVPTCTPEIVGCSPEELTATAISDSSTAAVATEEYALTQAWESANAKLTQTAMAVTTPPTGTATPAPLNTEQELHLLLDWLTAHRNDPAVQQWLIEHGLLNPVDIGNDAKLLEAVNQALIPWQNQYNADIQRIADENNTVVLPFYCLCEI